MRRGVIGIKHFEGPSPKEKRWKRAKNFKEVSVIDPNNKSSRKPPPGVMGTRRVEDLFFRKEKKGGEEITVPNVKREGDPRGAKREGLSSSPVKKEEECPVRKQVIEESHMNEHLNFCPVSNSAPAPAQAPKLETSLIKTTQSKVRMSCHCARTRMTATIWFLKYRNHSAVLMHFS